MEETKHQIFGQIFFKNQEYCYCFTINRRDVENTTEKLYQLFNKPA
jgi:uncharacterized protein YlbG (UPF0298 family)